jgi:hypothetical protein
MNQLWIVPLSVVCFVLAADIIVTCVRKRLQSVSNPTELLVEKSLGGPEDERVATNQE